MSTQPGVLRFGLSKFEWIVILLVGVMLFIKVGQAKWPVSDARVYVRAAQDLLAGESLYQRQGLSEFYRFKYPPTAALFFVPLTIFPFWVIRVVMALLITVSLLLIMRIVESWGPPADHVKTRLLVLLVFGGMIHYEFHLGQITLFLIAILLLVAQWIDDKRDGVAAFIYSLTLHLKPFGWPILLWAAFRGRNEFLVRTVLCTVLLAGLTIPFFGVQGTLDNWKGFVGEMGILTSTEVEKKQPILLSFGPAVDNWTHFSTGIPLRWKPWAVAAVNFSPFLLLFLFLWARVPHEIADAKREIVWVLAVVPLAGPSEYKYFQFLIPMAWLGLATWAEMPSGRRLLLVLGMTGIGINIYDLWGRALSNTLMEWSIVTIGAFLLFWTGFQTALRPNVGAVDVEKQMVTRLGWVPRPTSSEALLYKCLLVLGILGLFGATFYQLQGRKLCRVCDEETAPDNRICKNCSSNELVPYWNRMREMDRYSAALRRIRALVGKDAKDPQKVIQAQEKIQSEFSDVPATDWKKLMKHLQP